MVVSVTLVNAITTYPSPLTDTELQPVTSTTSTPRAMAAARSTWSLPMPAVMASFSLGAASMRAAVR